ncbi:MAG: fibronectin type III domain-containing protein [Oscillospiraceae bacterium]|nr:fibronectin type III domain-containing protein [Oscillospiraceae bacterium]
MKKTSLAFLLSTCLVLIMMTIALSGTADDGSSCGKNLIWIYDPDSCTLTISGSGPMRNYPHSTHDNRTHPWAEYDEEIRTIVVMEGVTSLGTCAFCSCTSLTEVRLPVSLETIGDNAFWNCLSLPSVTIPRKVSTIAANAFKRCSTLTRVTFLGNSPRVDATAFQGIIANAYYPAWNGSWTEQTMTGHGGTLMYHGFDDPHNIQYLTNEGPCGADAFWTFNDGVLTVSGTGPIEYPILPDQRNEIRRVVIEEGITSLADNAFTRCTSLYDVQLPESLTAIGKNAFALNGTITQIQIPDAVTEIGGGAFAGCTALLQADLPESLLKLGDRAFYACTSLSSLTIPASVTNIGSEALAGCTSLETLRFQGPGPSLADVEIFSDVTANVIYPVDQHGWSALRNGLSDTGLRWEPYCSGVHTEKIGTVSLEATCTTFGQLSCQCPVCGLDYTVEIIPVDHTFSEGSCVNCGYEQPRSPTITYCTRRDENTIKIIWTPMEDVDGYELFRTSAPDGQGWRCTKSILDSSADSYINHDVPAGTPYFYKIRSFHLSETGKKIYSDFSSVEFPLDTVMLKNCYSNTPGRIRLQWDAVNGAAGYQVWRMEADGTFSIVKTIHSVDGQTPNTAYSNADLTPGQSYTYKIRAFKYDQEDNQVFGEFSSEVTVTVAS